MDDLQSKHIYKWYYIHIRQKIEEEIKLDKEQMTVSQF